MVGSYLLICSHTDVQMYRLQWGMYDKCFFKVGQIISVNSETALHISWESIKKHFIWSADKGSDYSVAFWRR